MADDGTLMDAIIVQIGRIGASCLRLFLVATPLDLVPGRAGLAGVPGRDGQGCFRTLSGGLNLASGGACSAEV